MRCGTTRCGCSMRGSTSTAESREGSIWRRRRTHARESFNSRFWNATEGYLFDVIDGEHGDDPACRPNQILAISLDHPVLDESRWLSVMQVVRERLLTPVGLRIAGTRASRLQGEILRRSSIARRGLPSGHGLGMADRPVRGRVVESLSGRPRRSAPPAAGIRRTTSARRASDRSARSSTPILHSSPGDASHKRGASRKCCGAS